MKHDERTNLLEPNRRNFLKAGAAGAGAVLALGAGCAARAHDQPVAQPVAASDGYVTTSDGVRLHYIARGSGRPLVLIHGWSQSAALFREQLAALSSRYQVIALDLRGHGESAKPEGGYRVARLAQDTHEALAALGLRDFVLGAHSMGCAVVWSYLEHYGPAGISKLLLVDGSPCVTAWPGWSDDQKAEAGTFVDSKSLYEIAGGLAGADGAKVTEGFIYNAFFTKQYPREQLAWVLAESLKLPRAYAARLLVDHCTQDWRDVIRTIRLPTLVVGGTASIFNPKSQRWIAQQIPGSRVEIFEEAEGGGHFPFLENPAKFNRLVTEFLG
ncbi:MAG TPA: alpha/beta hydrolase [Kofleriaceae bacterium]|nr:alpha/beta hydrolase [Kofleriaceae bacterium]